MTWRAQEHKRSVSVPRLPRSVANLRRCSMLPSRNDPTGPFENVLHLRLFRMKKQAHLQMHLNLRVLQRRREGERERALPRAAFTDRRPEQNRLAGFHSQNPNSLRGDCLYHCKHIGMAPQPPFNSSRAHQNPLPALHFCA